MNRRLLASQFSPILFQLRDDWQYLARCRATLHAIRQWRLPGGPVESLDDVLTRCGYCHCPGSQTVASQDAGDAFLLQLVTLAHDEPLAARIVLQRILPGLVGATRRHLLDTGRIDLLDEMIANAWAIIRCYPVERRPRHVAANLVRDVTFQTVVRPTRRRSADLLPIVDEPLVADEVGRPIDPLHELADVLAAARHAGSVDDDDVDLICRLVTVGRPEQLAALDGVTPRTIRNRRKAVLHRLRAFTSAAA